jgi:hypothetical protein
MCQTMDPIDEPATIALSYSQTQIDVSLAIGSKIHPLMNLNFVKMFL